MMSLFHTDGSVTVVTGSTPDSYTANDRFAVEHGFTNFVGKSKEPSRISIQETVADQYETQSLAISGSPTGGTFTLTFDGQTTSDLDHDATAAEVQAALEALSTIGSGNVACTGGALPGTAVVIDFTGGDLAGTFPSLITTTDSLTGGTTPASAVTVTHTYTHKQIAVVGKDKTNVYLRASGDCTFEIHSQ